MIENIVTFLKGILRLNQSVEAILIDVISSISPWLAPILPAYLTGSNLYSVLNYPWQIAVVVALVIETIGLSSMSTVLMLWSFNETKRERDPYAPVGLAVISGALYICVVLSVNVLLEIDPQYYRIWVNGLMSLMTVVAALIIAVRGQHARRIEEITAERKARREERLAEKTGNFPETFQKVPTLPEPYRKEDKQIDWRYVPEADRRIIASMDKYEVMQKYNVPDKTARNWLIRAKNNGYHKETIQ